jgi:cationic peptide transport system ATP-binding protein
MKCLLELKNIHKEYKKYTSPFKTTMVFANKNIHLHLYEQMTLAIAGESNAGKTTLVRIILGLEKSTRGQVILNQQDLHFDNQHHKKKRFQYIKMIVQNSEYSYHPHLKMGKLLNIILKMNTSLMKSERRKKIESILLLVGLHPTHRYYYSHHLSEEEKIRMAIARSIILTPKIIIADDILLGLDLSIQIQMIHLLKKLQKQFKFSMIFISNNFNAIQQLATHLLIMHQGEILEQGSVETIYASPSHSYTQALLNSSPLFLS